MISDETYIRLLDGFLTADNLDDAEALALALHQISTPEETTDE